MDGHFLYDFTLINFPGSLRCTEVAENDAAKLEKRYIIFSQIR